MSFLVYTCGRSKTIRLIAIVYDHSRWIFLSSLRCSRTNSTRRISVNQSNFWNMIFTIFNNNYSKIWTTYWAVFMKRWFLSKSTHQNWCKMTKNRIENQSRRVLLKNSCLIAENCWTAHWTCDFKLRFPGNSVYRRSTRDVPAHRSPIYQNMQLNESFSWIFLKSPIMCVGVCTHAFYAQNM